MLTRKFMTLGAFFIVPTLCAADDSFSHVSGYYAEGPLPLEIVCPAGGYFLAPDGQLLKREMALTGVNTTAGYQCNWTDGFATCVSGAVQDGQLVVDAALPDTRFQRLTDIGGGSIVLSNMDGKGTPKQFNLCPPDFDTLTAKATPAAFAALPPPARVADGPQDPAAATWALWADIDMKPLGVTGIYAMFPRTSQSKMITDMVANIPAAQLKDMAAQYGFDTENATPERILLAIESEGCTKNPVVFTSDGLMINVGVDKRSDGSYAGLIDGVAGCQITDGQLSCTRGQKVDGIWKPDPNRAAFAWLWVTDRGEAPWLCDPNLGADNPNACAELIQCADTTSNVAMRQGGMLTDLTNWRPGQ